MRLADCWEEEARTSGRGLRPRDFQIGMYHRIQPGIRPLSGAGSTREPRSLRKIEARAPEKGTPTPRLPLGADEAMQQRKQKLA
jgi:hypothetical protein